MLKVLNETRIAIIGGGPAGLSLAKFLNHLPHIKVTVFEGDTRVGGKSWTYRDGEAAFEMGTCYATRADTYVRKWFKEYGLETRRLGSASVDGVEYFEWAEAGEGDPLPWEAARYLIASARLNRGLQKRPNDPELLAEAAMPILDWLRARGLKRIERLHYRAVTNMGYGRLDQTPTIQAIRWVDHHLMISGRLNDFLMPRAGWTELWVRLSADMDVRTDMPVTQVTRTPSGVDLVAGGYSFQFDKVVCAIPLDDFAAMTAATENETYVNANVSWNAYATTLMAVKDWFTEESVRSFEKGILLDAPLGALMSARLEGYSEDLGGHLYVLNQLIGPYSADELVEIAKADIRADGGEPISAVLSKLWKYFPQYSQDAVANGMLQRLEDMQGENNTFYTGATFSHEAVSKITRFNAKLARIIETKTAETLAAR